MTHPDCILECKYSCRCRRNAILIASLLLTAGFIVSLLAIQVKDFFTSFCLFIATGVCLLHSFTILSEYLILVFAFEKEIIVNGLIHRYAIKWDEIIEYGKIRKKEIWSDREYYYIKSIFMPDRKIEIGQDTIEGHADLNNLIIRNAKGAKISNAKIRLRHEN